jgi:uncharacterized sporulation protein YeaH/YhbH (DUF444 family)
MDSLDCYFNELKQRGLTKRQEAFMRAELAAPRDHEDTIEAGGDQADAGVRSIYAYTDGLFMQSAGAIVAASSFGLRTLDELLERDKQREQDGFPRKIRVGKLIKPGKSDKSAIVIVPTTVEEKFVHDRIKDPSEEGGEAGGTGDGEEGEVIGEQPVRPRQGEGSGAGEGGDASHEMESSAYDLGKVLTEKFQLPNLKDRGAKRSLTRYTYDITDKNRGFGQVLDKKSTLRKIIQTNIALGRVDADTPVDASGLLVSPTDRIYRTLSREKDYESQAIVFFVRDYSGSMAGKCTEQVVSQHVLVYSWLLYQYARRVETRFILHDTNAKEVPDFYTYYNSRVAGGTQVSAAYRLVNDIVEKESLARDYNIYIFHGTDGDDWDTRGEKAIPELRRMLDYANRVGITIVQHAYGGVEKTEVHRYLQRSGLLEEQSDLLRMDVIDENADESRLIEGIRNLLSDKEPAT